MVLVTHDIDEAIFLGDQVIVMGHAPDTMKEKFSVDLNRPRDRSSAVFTSLKKEVLSKLLETPL